MSIQSHKEENAMRRSAFAFKLPVAVTLIALLIAACGGAAAPTAAPEATEAPPEATEAPAEPTEAPAATEAPAESTVTITWWHIQIEENNKALWQALADEYQAANPNVTIEITVLENENFKTKLTSVMQSGEPPDIFQSWGGGVMNEYASAGLLKDITTDLAADGWGDSFSPGALGVYSFEGKNYGVPRDMGMVGFWYNKALFEQAGIEAPPATWAELLEAVDKLKAAGITPIALGEGDKWPGAFWWEYLAVRIGGQPAFNAAVSREGAFTDPAFIQAGEALQELVAKEPFQDGFLAAAFERDESAIMGNGQAAIQLMGQWAPTVQAANSTSGQGIGDDLGWFPFPVIEGGAGDPADALGGGNGFVVGVNAPPEAVDFLKFLSSVDAQTRQAEIGMSVPVVKGAEAGLTDPLLQIVQQNAASAPYFQLYYDQYMPPAVGSVINDSVQGLFAGAMTPEEVAQAIEDSATAELE
jgi:raffinose/stachyose/melibiose transport system substrate-binding protein